MREGNGLASVLSAMRAQGVVIAFRDGAPVIRGDPDPELRAALAEHRAHLLRLAESDAGSAGCAAWRVRLKRADDQTREAWALVAHGHEAAGLSRRAAEWAAWEVICV